MLYKVALPLEHAAWGERLPGVIGGGVHEVAPRVQRVHQLTRLSELHQALLHRKHS